MTKIARGAKIIFMIAVVLSTFIIIAFLLLLVLHPVGPGLPPDQDFAAVMVSSQSSSIPNCSVTDRNTELMPELCVMESVHENYPAFPELTPMTGHVIFCNTESFEQRVAVFWYFNREEDFEAAKNQLVGYLHESGSIAVVELELDLGPENYDGLNTGQGNSEPVRHSIPQKITGSSYVGNSTAGYFFIVNRPISKTREDYFIEYIGLVGNTNLTDGSADLKKIIATNGDSYYLFIGDTVPLE